MSQLLCMVKAMTNACMRVSEDEFIDICCHNVYCLQRCAEEVPQADQIGECENWI